MRALILFLLLSPCVALADPAIGDEALWPQLLPVAERAAADLAAIRSSCVPPMCNLAMLQAEIERQLAAALARCPVLYAGSPPQTELCIKFENVVFQ